MILPQMAKPVNQNFITESITRGFEHYVAPDDCLWVSDFLGDEWRFWNRGDVVFISCPTSTGKTTFVKELTKNVMLKVLILTNRRANKDQIKADLGYCAPLNFSNFDVISYQTLELNVAMDVNYLDCYDFIVCDEGHYLVQDGLLNSRVGISLEKLLATKATKIVMSATIEYVFSYLKYLVERQQGNCPAFMRIKLYEMRKSKLQINNIYAFDNTEDLVSRIKKTNYQWLIFTDSINEGKRLAKEIGEDAFCLDSASVDSDIRAKAVYDKLIQHETFDARILITTSLLDNGVNIKNPNLKAIVISYDSRVEIVQMAGRKRSVSADDTVDIYLQKSSSKKLQGRRRMLLEKRGKFFEYMQERQVYAEPNLLHMDNGKEGQIYRQAVYYNHGTRKYNFNWLGLQNILFSLLEIEKLMTTENQFDVKKSWLLGTASPPEVTRNPRNDILHEEKVFRFMEKLKPYRGKVFGVRGEEWEAFQWFFSSTFWEVFGLDLKAGHRKNRPLSYEKMCYQIRKHMLPMDLVKTEVDGKAAVLVVMKPVKALKKETQ